MTFAILSSFGKRPIDNERLQICAVKWLRIGGKLISIHILHSTMCVSAKSKFSFNITLSKIGTCCLSHIKCWREFSYRIKTSFLSLIYENFNCFQSCFETCYWINGSLYFTTEMFVFPSE